MPVSLIIAYPRGTNLDIDYYTNKHIPMIMSRWEPYVKGYRVLKSMSSSYTSNFPQSSSPNCPFITINGVKLGSTEQCTAKDDGADENPYALMTVTEFDSLEDIAEARVSVDEEGEKEIVEDLKRCTDRKPVWWTVESWGS